jgi:hypothetical protein
MLLSLRWNCEENYLTRLTVAARTRQLRHRINGRKQAILERRANEPGPVIRGTSPSLLESGNGVPSLAQAGFVAVNARHSADGNGHVSEFSKTGASTSTRNELMSKFFTQAEKDRRNAERTALSQTDARNTSSSATASLNLAPQNRGHTVPGSTGQPTSPLREGFPHSEQYEHSPYYASGPQQQSRPAQHNRTSSSSGPSPPNAQGYAHPNFSPKTSQRPTAKEKEAESPYRAEMVSRMDSLKRGERIIPPCDRCRRLHMDCVKNLTACQGCTKKHAKCSWRDVRQSEVFGPDAGKMPIPFAETDEEREPSVGFRPDERENPSPQSTTPSSGVFAGHEVPRTLPMDGVSASQSMSMHTTSDPMHHHLYSLRYESNQVASPRTDEETLSHVERAAATAAAAVSHSDSGAFGERRDGNLPVVA